MALEKQARFVVASKNPKMHKIILIDTSGERIETYSTYGKEGQEIKLEICPKIHPAWNKGGSMLNQKIDQVIKFKERNERFGSFQIKDLSGKKPKDSE